MLRGLLPYFVMKVAATQAFHGYQLIKLMRKRFGVYFGASTIYPLLSSLEDEGLLKSQWEYSSKRPHKLYVITEDGRLIVDALTSTMQVASTFEGQILQPKPKNGPGRHSLTVPKR